MLAIAMRLVFVWVGPGPGFVPTGDQVDFHYLARALSVGDGYVLPGNDGVPYATAFRPPLLPLVLAPFYALFGGNPFVGLLVETFLGASIAVAAWGLARRFWDERTARLAGLVVAVYPLLIFFSGMLLSETLFALLLLLAAFPLSRWWRDGRIPWAFVSGLVLGVATLARPTVPAWAFFVVVAALILGIHSRDRVVRGALVMMLGGALVILPWSLRNTLELGEFVPLTTGGGCALYDGNNPYVLESPELRGSAWSLRSVEPYATEFEGLSEVEIDRLSLRHAVEFWKSNPQLIPQLVFWKEARFWRARAQQGRTTWWIRPDSPAARIASLADPLLLSYGLVFPFFLLGAWLAIRNPRHPAFLLLLAIATQALLAAFYWGSLRFRVPVEPFIILLAASGFFYVWDRVRQRKTAPTP